MNLQNGYKVIYEKAADGKRTFYASKTGVFADAEVITEAEIGKYKLIYEKAGRFYGSETGIPAEGDYCFTDFDKVFVADAAEPKDEDEDEDEDEVVDTPDKPIEIPTGEPTTEQPVEEEGEF